MELAASLDLQREANRRMNYDKASHSSAKAAVHKLLERWPHDGIYINIKLLTISKMIL